VVVFDPLGEYRAEGFREIRHDHAKALDEVRIAMARDWSNFRIAYVPPAGKEAEALSILSAVLKRVQEPYRECGAGAPLILAVEEMNLSFPVAGGAERSPGFADLCSRGRHYGITLVGVSQRIAEVSTRFRGNASQTVVFAQKGRRDLDAAERETGAPRASIAGLKSLEFLAEKNRDITSGKIVYKRGKPYLA